MINESKLKSLGFARTHRISLPTGASSLPVFEEIDKHHPSLNESSVYLWLSPVPLKPDSYEVLYVGKAGYGTTRRFSQHRGGFRKHTSGSNCALILEKLDAGKEILVFGKVADKVDLFGVTISRYSTEEEAFCKCLNPLWNRAGFPDSANSKNSVEKIKVKAKKVSKLKIELEEDTSLWFEALTSEDKDRFSSILRYAESIDILREMPQKVSAGYSGQPTGYNNIPMIVYGRVSKSGRVAGNAWFLRIPLPTSRTSMLTLFIPQCFSAETLNHGNVVSHRAGSQAFFFPKNVDDFLRSPQKYVDWTKTDTRSV